MNEIAMAQTDTAGVLRRGPDDALDCVPLVLGGLAGNRGATFCRGTDGATITFGELAGRIAAVQAWLHTQGVRPGDRVAVMMGNSVGHVALVFALMLSRVVWIPVNTRLREAGVRYIVEHARPRLLVIEAGMAGVVAGLESVAVVLFPDHAGMAVGPDAGPHAQPVRPDDTLSIIYTSGTTGSPKGVLFTHRMLRIAAEAAILVSGARAGDRMLFWEPLCHVGGAQMLMLPFLLPIELHMVDRFSAKAFWAQMREARATHLHYLGGILDILPRGGQQAASPESLREIWGAGASPQAWQYFGEHMGIRLRECYGMTECASFATVNLDGTPHSIGKPLAWIDIELWDTEGQPVALGEIGEMVLSSRIEGAFAAGYLDNPAASAAMAGGRLRTGDLARQDARGNFYFVGRRTDSMRVRGENVSAWEVERVFSAHPGVEASAAVGVPAAVGEQEILLYVKPKAGMRLDPASLHEWAAAALAPFQLPRYIRLVEHFVTTPSERIRKQFLARDPAGAWDANA